MINTDFSNAPAMYFWGTPNNYAVKPSPECDLSKIPNFSIFRRPITNKRPYQVVNLVDVYNYIISSYAKDRTLEYRGIKVDKYRKQYKASKFDYCTFSGIFSIRADKTNHPRSHRSPHPSCRGFGHRHHAKLFRLVGHRFRSGG